MVKKCLYCGFVNINARIDNPIKCPRCGNMYGKKPMKKRTYVWNAL